NAEFDFSLDVCASPQNAKCARYFSSDDDGLSQSWAGEICFCNPPYHRHLISAWITKAYEESRQPDTTVALLIPTYYREYSWWKKYCVKGQVRFIHPFVRFQRCDGEGTALKDVILIVLGKKYKPMTSGPVIGMNQTSA
ncbi:MAG: adenine methyltransferase, partial [Planctomycetes bacterium]|nr:adenine methyltransferase [Planctomycetota bacterium]